MTKYSRIVVASSIVFLASLAHAADGLPGPNIPDGLGVNIHFIDPRPGEMEMLASAGFRWVRMDFAWDLTEREQGKYDFAPYDRLMTALDKHRMRAVFILDYSNPHYDHRLSPSTDAGRRAMARWAAAAARHFHGRGIVWEMYNEPNIFFWKPKPDVDQYARLALEVGRELAAAEPNEIYVGPATSTIDFKFLEKCFQAGLLKYWSAVSVHPYRQEGPETAAAEYVRLRRLIDRYAPQGKKIPILSGEWGYTAAWKNFDEARQGKMLPREFLSNLANGVPLSIWYDWHDDGQNAAEPEHHFGIVHFPYRLGQTPVYEPKPAYLAAKTLTSILCGFHFEKRLPLPSADDYAYVFVKGGEHRYAAWTTGKQHAVTLVVGGGGWTRCDHLGEADPPVVATEGAITITLTDAPQYFVQTLTETPQHDRHDLPR